MNISAKSKRVLVVHPFLFGVYAILGSYASNSTQVPVAWVMRPLLILLALVALLYSGLRMKLSDSQQAGLVATLTLFWFFFGHFHRAMAERSNFWSSALGVAIAFALWTIPLAFLASRWSWSRITNPGFITTFLNITSIIVLIVPLFVTGRSLVQTVRQTRRYDEQPRVNLSTSSTMPGSPPDIYYFILDGYGREDMLQNFYGFDNSAFLESLRQQGFYVASQSTANYPQTQLSLSSSLSFDYLDAYVAGFGDSDDHTLVYDLVQHSRVRQLLKEQGYTFVALPSTTLLSQIRDADIYFDLTGMGINEFEASLLSSTVPGVAATLGGVDLPVMGYEWHRKTIRFTLDKLHDVPQIPGPKFVFAHIMLPHPPFLFNRNGDYIQPDRPYVSWDASFFPGTLDEYRQGYVNQVMFLNGELEHIVSTILSASKHPPIIILQGDHGPGSHFNLLKLEGSCLTERYSIFNAYYFPDGDYRLLYPSISPVNTFRVILNQYFDAGLPMLEDKNYYATWTAPYIFNDVTDQVPLACSVPSAQVR